jgi:hypothetical protein
MKMKKTIMAFGIALLALTGTFAQKQPKPWSEWSKKDAEKILADSPWSQTQTETDTSEMVYTPTNLGDTRSRETQGATNQATSVKFHLRFFSARPIRQAYVRLLELAQTQPPDPATTEKRHAWANLEASDSIIVTVACEGNDARYLRRVMQAFDSAVTAVLKNAVYLERKDGKRVFLGEYIPPGKDVFGARFIFPRNLDGQPFITAEDGAIRFHAEYESKISADLAAPQASRTGSTQAGSAPSGNSSKFKLDTRFKLGDMVYGGVLEY